MSQEQSGLNDALDILEGLFLGSNALDIGFFRLQLMIDNWAKDETPDKTFLFELRRFIKEADKQLKDVSESIQTAIAMLSGGHEQGNKKIACQDKVTCPFGKECDGGWDSRDPQTGRLCRDALRRNFAEVDDAQ